MDNALCCVSSNVPVIFDFQSAAEVPSYTPKSSKIAVGLGPTMEKCSLFFVSRLKVVFFYKLTEKTKSYCKRYYKKKSEAEEIFPFKLCLQAIVLLRQLYILNKTCLTVPQHREGIFSSMINLPTPNTTCR